MGTDRDQGDQAEGPAHQVWWRKRALAAEGALKAIRSELGVPGPDCPAAAANAYRIADEVLAQRKAT